MPLALWAAMSLKAGQPMLNPADWPAYVAVVAISIPIFVRFGLYRAVIRFLGHKAVFRRGVCGCIERRASRASSGSTLELPGAVRRAS